MRFQRHRLSARSSRSSRSPLAIAALVGLSVTSVTSAGLGGSIASASDASSASVTTDDADLEAALIDAQQRVRSGAGDSSPSTRTQSRAGSAATQTEAILMVGDPVGDATWSEGDMDITGVNAANTGLTVLAVGVETYDSPYGTNWQLGLTGPGWFLDTNGDFIEDYLVVMVNDGGVLQAVVFDEATERAVCNATPWFDAALALYGATLPSTCIGNPPTLRWVSTMLYEDVFSGVTSSDRAPDVGWAGPVVNDGFVASAPPTPPAPPVGTSGFESLVPARLLETRPGLNTVDGRFNGLGTVQAGTTTQLEVAGRGGVPANATAAVLNVTAVSPRSAGYLTIFPCGSARPNASSVNFGVGQTVPNAVMTRLGAGGTVCIYSQATVDLLVDVNGFFTGEQAFSSLNPARVVETRAGLATVDGQFNGIGAQPAGTTLEFVVAGRGGVPADASSVALNVTAVDARNPGFLTVYPCGTPRPNASSVNFTTGQTVANAVVSRVGVGGRVCIFTQAATDLIVDVNGWFGASSPFVSVVPARLLESRPGLSTVDGVLNGTGPSQAGSIRQVSVLGRGGVAPNATAVVLNVTVTSPTSAGFVTVFPCGSALPNASNLNFSVGQTVPNAVVSKVGTNGQVCIFTQATTDLIVDVNGFFL